MTDAKPTPGPWCVKYDDQYDHVFTQSTPHRRIANVFGGVTGTNDLDLEHQANAKLIAAAPELADCLRRLVDFQKNTPLSKIGRQYELGRLVFEAETLLKRIGM